MHNLSGIFNPPDTASYDCTASPAKPKRHPSYAAAAAVELRLWWPRALFSAEAPAPSTPEEPTAGDSLDRA